MDHQEIRFRILYSLYQKHYSPELGHPQSIEQIISDAGLSSISLNEIYGDVVYLEDKGFIKGQSALGYAYPLWISITSQGIDFVENIVNDVFEDIRKKHRTNVVYKFIKELQNEGEHSNRVKKVVEHVQMNSNSWNKMMQLVKIRFYN